MKQKNETKKRNKKMKQKNETKKMKQKKWNTIENLLNRL